MPVTYKILTDKKLLSIQYFGELTLAEILDLRKEGASDPDFSPLYSVIDDITRVTSTTITYTELSGISGQSVSQPGVKRALVAVTDLQLGMANMYRVLSESAGQNFQIFKDYDSALEWMAEVDGHQ